jgi:P27 family predicted phage terminase small subunit
MKPPEDFTPEARTLWRATLAALRKAERDPRELRVTLERYIRVMDVARRARAQVEAEGLTVPGANGAQVAHPLLRIALAAERDALKLGQALGIEPQPAARNAGGRPRGSASAPDRAAKAAPPKLRMVR